MIDITEDQNSLCAAEVRTTEDLKKQKDMFMDWKSNAFSLFKQIYRFNSILKKMPT